MRPLLAIIRKDLKLHVGNRRALILTLAVPIAIASFFGSLFGGQSGKTKSSGVPIQITDLDDSTITRKILTNILADASLKATLVPEAEARAAIKQGKTAVAVIFPKNFGADASSSFFSPGAKPELTVLHDPSRNIESSMVQGILMQHIMQAVSQNIFSGTGGRQLAQNALKRLDLGSGLSPADNGALRGLLTNVDQWLSRVAANTNLATTAGRGSGGGAGGGFSLPFKMKDEESEAPAESGIGRYNGYAHSFAGMGMQFVLMAAIDWGLGILLERQRGLWRRLRAAPLSRRTLLLGRASSSTLIALSTLAICWAFSMVVFHVQINGSWLGFFLINLGVSTFAASLGLFIAALGRTPEATRGLAIFVLLMLVMLGGAWIPSFIFPAWLQNVTIFIPTRWAMDGYDAMTWRGLGLSAALAPAAVLFAATALCGWFAHRCFRWEAD